MKYSHVQRDDNNTMEGLAIAKGEAFISIEGSIVLSTENSGSDKDCFAGVRVSKNKEQEDVDVAQYGNAWAKSIFSPFYGTVTLEF